MAWELRILSDSTISFFEAPESCHYLMRDPYGELGLTHSASLDEIKKAFRRLALEHHPDRHVNDM